MDPVTEVRFNIFQNGPDAYTVSVSGWIDSTNSEQFLKLFETIGEEKAVTLDAAELSYLSSAGIRVLVMIAKRHKDRFSVINAGPFLMEILVSTGLTRILPILPAENVPAQKDRTARAAGKNFCDLLQKWADRPLFYRGEKMLTYADVDRISHAIAADLFRLGVGKYTHVGIAAADSPYLVCAFFAIVRLGAIAVMINPTVTRTELADLLHEGDVTHLCHDAGEGLAAELGVVEYSIGNDADFAVKDPAELAADGFADADTDPDDPCVMIFTSGSTGHPKGALHSFLSLQSGTESVLRASGVHSGDIFCHTLPLFHIGGLLLDLCCALTVGASLCFPVLLPGSSIVARMEQIFDTVVSRRCTVFNAIPTSLFSISMLPSFSPEKIRSVRCIMTGAMPITASQMQLLRTSYPAVNLIVVYGMTEILPAALISSAENPEHISDSVGKPVKDAELKLIRPDGSLCSAGECGEICLKAGQSMACYYKADLSRQPLDEGGYIRSGDLGILDAEGFLHIVGRSKDIIIRGGENIVPGEIEAAISALPEIRYVYVCGVPDEMMGEKVAAAVVMKDGCAFDPKAIKAGISAAVARHKIPSYLVPFDDIPLLPNGKPDKVTLKRLLTEESKK